MCDPIAADAAENICLEALLALLVRRAGRREAVRLLAGDLADWLEANDPGDESEVARLREVERRARGS